MMKSHYDKKFACEQCSYKATKQDHLNQHIKSIHEGVKYPCDQCNHKATTPSDLRKHVKSVHEGVKYPCEQCNYQANHLSQIMHIYPCMIYLFENARPRTLQW